MRIKKINPKKHNGRKFIFGYSIIEILIVIGIFAVFSIVVTQSVILSLRGTKKSGSVVNVKEDLEYAASTIERVLQNTKEITNPNPCTGTQDHIDFISRDSVQTSFNYTSGSDSRITQTYSGNTYRLTSGKVDITVCAFTCTIESGKKIIIFDVTGNARGVTGVEGGTYSTSRRIFLQQNERK
jgi:type II secretory pathway pseudopilin PulG